jgi:hypothetical protein
MPVLRADHSGSALKGSNVKLMNPGRTTRACFLLILLGATLGMVACSDRDKPVSTSTTNPETAAMSPPSQPTIGVEPAGPTQEAPTTTSNARSDVTKAQESGAMPMPGQANDHSTPAPKGAASAPATGR